ncbi:MAG: DUF47 family protein [Proteobacteria bacterium]|nr:DUF47 family protein [Pseudomonadota bacterium]
MFSLQTIFGSGKQFFGLLEAAAAAALDSAKALHAMTRAASSTPSLEEFKLVRRREREIITDINTALVRSFVTPIEREDIEALAGAIYRIPKAIEKFADRYALTAGNLRGIDFAPRAAMLEQAAAVVLEMVKQLKGLKLEPMKELNDRLSAIENEADRLMLELYRDLYAGHYDGMVVLLIKDFFELLEKAIDRCREAGTVVYRIVLKNS